MKKDYKEAGQLVYLPLQKPMFRIMSDLMKKVNFREEKESTELLKCEMQKQATNLMQKLSN